MPEYTIRVTRIYTIKADSQDEAVDMVALSEPAETVNMEVLGVADVFQL